MHEALTNSSTATKSFFPTTTSNDLLPPINLTNRPQTTDTNSWTNTHESDTEVALENWHLSSAPEDSPPSQPTFSRRPPSAGLQKLSFLSNMTPLTDNGAQTFDGGMNANSRWRFNGNGQLVDAEAASAGWDLADEIVRLNIGDVGGEAGEDATIRTPPKSKMAAAAVAHLAETSPLETSSSASIDSSPPRSDHQINISHSRGSSTDTTISSSQESTAGDTLLPQPSLKSVSVNELKERPHSFSGGLSSADLRRLQQAGDGPDADDAQLQQQQQQWNAHQYRESIAANEMQLTAEQLSYPSLANNTSTRPHAQSQIYDYRSGALQANTPNRDDLQIDYNIQQRNFNPLPQGLGTNGPVAQPFIQGRLNSPVQYRQPLRPFPQQGVLPSPTALGYPGAPHHTAHMSLGNTQQLYDMMLPGPPHDNAHPAVTRVQQQHNIYRGGHHHSASDPSALRDAATLQLLNNNMQFGPGMFSAAVPPPPPAMPMYPNQYYGPQDAYARPDAAAQVMAARLQSQYTGPYGMLPPQLDTALSSPTSTNTGQNGPSANNRKLGLYKTELCRSWEEKGTCRYGAKCQFAHGEDELRNVSRHPKYKTEICRTFWVSGSCPYGKRCCFIHTELPTSGGPPVTGSTAAENGPPPHSDGRARSLSTNSDPNEASLSLLARISAKRTQDPGSNTSSTPVDPNGFQFTRPATGTLRVDTSTLDSSLKQNKSAYPSFAGSGALLPAPEHISAKSPAPVTAGPDLGRHNNSRLEIVGYNQRVNKTTTPPSNSNPRHSFNGTEELGFSLSPPVSGHSYALSSGDSNSSPSQPRVNGHVRAGSAGNWGSLSRSSHLAASSFPHAPSPGDVAINSPWSTTELAVGSSRLNEKAWA